MAWYAKALSGQCSHMRTPAIDFTCQPADERWACKQGCQRIAADFL